MENLFQPGARFILENILRGGESFRLECWRKNYISCGVKRPKKPNRTEQEKLDDFLNELRLKRLKKNLSEQQLRRACVPTISPRAWWQWHRELKPGDQREFPNASHKKRLHEALNKLPKRPKKLVGRPSKAFKAECKAIAAKAALAV